VAHGPKDAGKWPANGNFAARGQGRGRSPASRQAPCGRARKTMRKPCRGAQPLLVQKAFSFDVFPPKPPPHFLNVLRNG